MIREFGMALQKLIGITTLVTVLILSGFSLAKNIEQQEEIIFANQDDRKK